MTSIKNITSQNLEDSSIRAQEIKNIHQKWGKYIDEGYGSINFWKYGSIIGIIAFVYSIYYNHQIILLLTGLINGIFIYFYSKRNWFREGFYAGYDTGKSDAFDEALEIEGIKEAVIKHRSSKK